MYLKMILPRYLKYNVMMLKFGGLYKVKSPVMIIWRFTCNFSLFFFVISSCLDVVINRRRGFNAVAINCVNIGIGTLVFLRTNYFYASIDKSECLVKNMNKIFKYVTETGIEEKSMKKYIKFTIKMSVAFLTSSLVFGEGFAVAQMLMGGLENRDLPYPMWYPYDWKASPIYELTIVQQLVCHMMLIEFTCSADMFYASSLLLTVGQLELLGWEFKNVVYTTLLEYGVPKEQIINFKTQFNNNNNEMTNYERVTKDISSATKRSKKLFEKIYDIVDSDSFNLKLEYKFKQLIQFHQTLTEFCRALEDFFSPVLLIYTLVFMVIALFSLFYMVTTDDQSVRIVFGGYIVLIPVDIVLTCLIGQLLTTQSEQLKDDLYEMPWYLCGKRFKRTLMIVHYRVRKPTTLTIGKFANLNLSTSLWILRTAFSYTTVLRQMTE